MIALNRAFSQAKSRSYPKGQVLLYQGEKTDITYRIHSGYVKIYDIGSANNEKLLLILGPGDVFPVMWTFEKADSLLYFYEAITNVELSMLKRKEFTDYISTNLKASNQLLKYMVQAMSDLMSRIECIEATGANHKVGMVLLYLAKTHGKPRSLSTCLIEVPITHQMIADMAGLTRETTSTHLKEFERGGILSHDSKGRMVINNRKLRSSLK